MPQTIDNMIATWANSSTTFTALKMNVQGPGGGAEQSAAASLLMDLQVGGSSRFRVNKAGAITADGLVFGDGSSVFNASLGLVQNRFTAASGASYAFSSTASPFGSPDIILTRRAAANLRLGSFDTVGSSSAVTIDFATNANNITWASHGLMTGSAVMFSAASFPTSATGNLDASTTYYAVVVNANTIQIARTYDAAVAATPTVVAFTGNGTTVAARGARTEQTLSVQNFTGTDMPGSPLVFDGAQGTGAGNGGPIIFRVAPKGSSGSLVNGLATALTIGADRNATFGGNIVVAGGAVTRPFSSGSGSTALNILSTHVGLSGFIEGSNNVATFGFGNSTNTHNGLFVTQSGYFGWYAFDNTAPDLRLYRDATNTLALRNGGTSGSPVPQTFRVYNWTDGTNSEFGVLKWSANTFFVGSEAAGTGDNNRTTEVTGGAVHLNCTNSGNTIRFKFSGSDSIYFDTAGQVRLNNNGAHVKFGTSSDAGIVRADASVLRVSNGSTGGGSLQLTEMTAPAAPATNNVRIYAEDNGSGKTRLMARFGSGDPVQIAIEP